MSSYKMTKIVVKLFKKSVKSVIKFFLDLDEALEYEEKDILDNFKTFYDDVVSKLKTYGKLMQFLVCSNYQRHLRGNVYVQYEEYFKNFTSF